MLQMVVAAYYGCGYYNRLDSYYGIAAAQNIKGEFGFDGKKFDLSIWAVGEQEFAGLKQGGYIAPVKDSMEMENWMGDFAAWCGASGRVALFTEAFWTFQGTWNTEAFKQYNLDIVPYVVPAVNKDDATKDHHSIATIDFGGLTTSCKHPREAYELLKFMSFGKDGWKTRIALYNDESKTNANGLALKYDVMPAPITTDSEVWDAYIKMYCKGMDDTHVGYWKEYFKSCMHLSLMDGLVSQVTGTTVMNTSTRLVSMTKLTVEHPKLLTTQMRLLRRLITIMQKQ